MGLLSKVGEGLGSVGGALVGVAGDIAKGGVNLFSRIFTAGDENKDPLGINDAVGGVVDGTTRLAQSSISSAGRIVGQAGDDTQAALPSPITPAVPGFGNQSRGV